VHSNPLKNRYSTTNEIGNYWFKLNLQASQWPDKKGFLTIETAIHYDLSCYYYSDDSLIVQKAGLLSRKGSGTYEINPAFEILFKDTATLTVYVKANLIAVSENFNFAFLTRNEFYKTRGEQQFVFSAFYAILFVILIINILYYFLLRRNVFLFTRFMYFYPFASIVITKVSYADLLRPTGEYYRLVIATAHLLFLGFLPIMAIYYVQLERIYRLSRKNLLWFFLLRFYWHTAVSNFLF